MKNANNKLASISKFISVNFYLSNWKHFYRMETLANVCCKTKYIFKPPTCDVGSGRQAATSETPFSHKKHDIAIDFKNLFL